MSKFYVGQRVRVVFARTAEGRLFVGKEATVTSVWYGIGYDSRTLRHGYGLDIRPVMHDGKAWIYWSDDQLEPATDSYDVVSWKDCVWQPEHLRAGA